MNIAMSRSTPSAKTALVLSGGGAHAAYQVGVLRAIVELLPRRAPNPFSIICGTSAGALNAVALATHASRFQLGVHGLELVWRNFRTNQVFHSDLPSLLVRGGHWLGALMVGGLNAKRPVSLLNNAPLARLLERILRFDRISLAIERGDLHAVSVTCSGYSSGQSVSFFEAAREVNNWQRTRRVGLRARLGVPHLMASSAIPMLFPAVRLNREYFGDGSIRQVSPLSPALHLGADRILVLGVNGGLDASAALREKQVQPTTGKIIGHMLNAAFLDGLELDVARLERTNRIAELLSPEQRAATDLGLRHIDLLKILPSRPLDEIANRFADELPRSLRLFLRRNRPDQSTGATLLSYLLFERGFCRALIDLGYRDAMRRRTELLAFLGYKHVLHDSAAVPEATCSLGSV